MKYLSNVRNGLKHIGNDCNTFYQEMKMHMRVNGQIKKVKEQYKISELTRTQKEEIQRYWAKYNIKVSFKWHKMLYSLTGRQDPAFLTSPIFCSDVLPYMRNSKLTALGGDKAYLDFYIRDVQTVNCVLRNVSGRYLNHEFGLVSTLDAQKILDNSASELVIKPTMDTSTGKGVQLLHAPYNLSKLEKEYKENFVLQLPLHQHEEMAKLNPSSINTIRVNSVLIGTSSHVMSAFVKVGQAGEFADNHGHKRFFIGIRQDGRYQDYAIDHDMRKYDSIPSGYQFANRAVPFYQEVCDMVEKAHKCMPHFGMIFWDICVDKNGPIIVEANVRCPDTTVAQVAIGGPFFGQYTDKILKMAMQKRKNTHI